MNIQHELEKLYSQLNKKQIVGILTLLIVPGGIPVLLFILYKKYRHFLSRLEITIKDKD